MKEKNKLIVFKIPEFPHISETFIMAQIQTAIKLGFNVKIITRRIIHKNTHLIQNKNILNTIVIDDYKIPKHKITRSLKWIGLLLINAHNINYILKYYKNQKKFSLTWLYEFVFYKPFNKAAIFHVQYGTNSNPLPLLKNINFFKPKLIVTFHGHDTFFPINGFIENNGYYNQLFSCDALVTANTPYLADLIEKLGCPKHKIITIPVAVNTSFFYPDRSKSINKKGMKLIAVARLVKLKGHRYTIEVIHKLLKRGIHATLTIVGEGEERYNLQTLIVKLKLENHVFLLGSKTSDEVRANLWTHDICLSLTVPVEGYRRETQGLAPLEAQACGLPAIVFDSGGVKYTVKDGYSGFICSEYDTNAVVKKIEFLYKNPHVLANMGVQAVKFINKTFSQDHIDLKWKTIYKTNAKRK